MRFVSIRQKLTSSVTLTLAAAFLIVLAIVVYMNIRQTADVLANSEQQIRGALEAKGQLLATTSREALMDMVSDNAFGAVREMISGTLVADSDILLGAYIDASNRPWVFATRDNPGGFTKPGTKVGPSEGYWSGAPDRDGRGEYTFNGIPMLVFNAPVFLDDEFAGTVRYGISLENMHRAIAGATRQSRDSLWQTIVILALIGIAVAAFAHLALRRIAASLTSPLDSLTRAAGRLAAGDYDTDIKVESHDEIGLLAENFSSMTEAIRKKMSDLAELNAIGNAVATVARKEAVIDRLTMLASAHFRARLGIFFPETEEGEECINAPRSFRLGSRTGDEVICDEFRQKHSNAGTIQHEWLDIGGMALRLLYLPIQDNERRDGSLVFLGVQDGIAFDRSDLEFFGSVARLGFMTLKSVQMREVIEAHNRELEGKVIERTTQLVETQQKLVSQEKMAALGVFAAGMAHEINNPANFVSVGAQNTQHQLDNLQQFITDLLSEDADPDLQAEFGRRFDKLHQSVDVIKNGIERIERIIKSLRASYPDMVTEAHPVNIVEMIIPAWNVVAPNLSCVVEFVTHLESHDEVQGIAPEFNQVIMAVLSNAGHSIEERAAIESPGWTGRIEATSRLHAGILEIDITDTGTGMPDRVLTKIFDPFFTTKPVGKGSGLGLSMAREVIQRFNGTIAAESTVGHGSRLLIRFPVAAPCEASTAP